jgi:hypothetical protein
MSRNGIKWARAVLVAAMFAAWPAFGQAPIAEKPKVYALVSAIGSEITVVRQRRDVGSNIEPYRRYKVPVPGMDMDAAVLRGLDRAVASDDPESKRIFLRLAPDQIAGVHGYQRGQVLSEKALATLAAMSERKDWDRIILVAPRYLNVAREGIGPKLHGIGIYIQPLGRGGRSGEDDIESALDPETISPDGEKSNSYKSVAPYFYAQLWVIDAKTMKVLETNDRYDFQRIYDPKSTAIDVAQQMPVDVLTNMVEKFVERASARALNDQQGEVIIKEPRVVTPAVR